MKLKRSCFKKPSQNIGRWWVEGQGRSDIFMSTVFKKDKDKVGSWSLSNLKGDISQLSQGEIFKYFRECD